MVLTPRNSEVVTTAILQRRRSYTQNGGKAYDTITCAATTTAASFPAGQCERYKGPSPQFLRLNSVQPYTVVFSVQNEQLLNLSVQEVIDTLSEQLTPCLMNSLRGVRLVGGSCFLSFSSQEDTETVLQCTLTIRGLPLLLEDASSGTAILALNGVPHDVTDEAVATVLSNFGTLVGTVERRLYKGVDTGERLARLRARLAVPRSLWLGGCRVSLRVLQDEEIAALSIVRRKSFRSHINVRLQPVSSDVPADVPPLLSTSCTSPPSTDESNQVTSIPLLKSTPTAPANTPVHPSPLNLSTAGSYDSQTVLPTTPTPNSIHDTPFQFPPPHTTQTHLDPNGMRRVNSVIGTSSLTGVDVPHPRSQSTPPCVSDIPPKSAGHETEIQGQSSVPASPSIIKKPIQRHRPSRKAPKVNTDIRKINGEHSASSSSGQDSPSKPNRRKGSVYFNRRDKSYNRTTSIEHFDGLIGDGSERERSNSDVSSRISVCRRKLSTTGRESGKVPWCGCWGNGCI